MSLNDLKRNFDIRSFLDSIGTDYSGEGDNVSSGWIGMQCCFCNDHMNHLGIRLKDNFCTCWLCKEPENGSVIEIIKELTGYGNNKAINVLKEFQKDSLDNFEDDEEKEDKIIKKGKRILPSGFKKLDSINPPGLVRKYFKRRKFSVELIDKYKLGWCRTGYYAYRLIIPIYIDREIVSFVAADMTGEDEKPYLMCPNRIALIPKREVVYGIDAVKNKEQIIIVEGATDKWRIGDYGIALLTKNWSREMFLLIRKRIRNDCLVKVLLDLDAYKDGEELAYNITQVFSSIMFIGLERKDKAKDPDKLTPKQIRKILSLK